jgi:NAD(P)-dependent dehydrogenase (short-subunit alcohol dehydrogenase family)
MGEIDFTDKIVLVTGAGRGTGRRVAETFAAHSACVAANDISPVNLEQTIAHILAAKGQVRPYVEDIAKKMPFQGLLNSVLDDFGRIDILINCAEVEPQKTVLEMDEWDWQRTMDVNLSGAFLLTQSAGRIMKEKGGGIIIHVGERAKSPEKRAAYFASKAGLAALSALAAYEFSEHNIRVHHIQPDAAGDVVQSIMELCVA